MTQINFSRNVPFSADQMLDLVADVNAYPEFVPNCEDMRVRRDSSMSPDQCAATMSVRFGPISGSYTSLVTVDRAEKTVTAVAEDGPFSHLTTKWTIVPKAEGAEICFDLDFAFSNPFIAKVAEPLFAAKQEEVIDAFVARAGQKYQNG